MSINSMANAAVIRDALRGARVEPTSGTGVPSGITSGSASMSEQVTNVLTTITTYIPTEILTLYVAVRSALTKSAETGTPTVSPGGNWPEWIAFFGFLAFTPLVVWIVFATRLRSTHHRLPLNPRRWPLWEMAAATIAYVAWAFGLPNSVFNAKAFYSPAMAAVVVLVTSTFLGLLTPLFSKSR